MQLSGLLHGAKLLRFVNFPVPEVLGPDASEAEIKAMIDRHGMVFVKPIFKGAIGKKGKAGLVGKARDLKTALAERERLYFVQHTHGNVTAKSQGVTFEAAVPAEHEVYFAIADSTRYRAPTITITHHGGVDIEELGKDQIANVPFEALTGLKAFVIANALADIKAPRADHLAPGAASAQAVGAGARFRHLDARAQPDPDARRRARPADAGGLRLQVRLRPRRPALGAAGPARPSVRRRPVRVRDRDQPAPHPPGPERRLRHQPDRHHPGADLRRRRQLAGERGAGRRCDHLLRLRRQPALREDEGCGADLLQALAGAVQRPVHHRRQVQQHRHLHHLPRHGRRAARAFQRARADAALRRGRPRRAEPDPRHGGTAGHGRGAGPALPVLRLRFGDQRGRQLRPGRRPLDEGRRPRAGAQRLGMRKAA